MEVEKQISKYASFNREEANSSRPLCVQLINVTKTYGSVNAVDNISLNVYEGELLVILGPSGCGKTTTLRLIAGLEKVDKGAIHIKGKDFTYIPANKRNVGMVFQHFALYPMTAFKNLAFPLRAKGLKNDMIEKKVKEIAKLLKIEDILGKRVDQLSGGQMQRVAIGRALIRRHLDVLLLDEPFSNLDANLRATLRAELVEIHKRLGRTILHVTHDQREALAIADGMAVMNEGKILQVATPKDIYNKPANTFVAGFIGAPPMNFLEGEVLEKKDGQTFVNFYNHQIALPSSMRSALQAIKRSKKIILGFRPEDVVVSDRPDLSDKEKITGIVRSILFEGRSRLIKLGIDDHIFQIRDYSELNIRPGDKISFSIKTECCCLFEPTIGRSIWFPSDIRKE